MKVIVGLRANISITRQKVCNNWGKWGAEDQIGHCSITLRRNLSLQPLNWFVVVSVSLSIPLDNTGPQEPNRFTRRHNPVHTMLATGADVVAGVQLLKNGSGYADCAISLPTQCSTQSDALAHVFHEYEMYNGFGAELVNANGAAKKRYRAHDWKNDRAWGASRRCPSPRY